MKKFIVIFALMLVTFVGKAQLAQSFGVLYEKTMQDIGLIGSISIMGLLTHFNKGGEL